MTRALGKPSLVRQEKEQRRIGTGELEAGRLGTMLGREEVIYLLHSQAWRPGTDYFIETYLQCLCL